MSTDFIGQPLKVGDRVIFMWKRWKDSRQLRVGTIKSVAPQTCVIEYKHPNYASGQEQRQYYDQIVRHPEQRAGL